MIDKLVNTNKWVYKTTITPGGTIFLWVWWWRTHQRVQRLIWSVFWVGRLPLCGRRLWSKSMSGRLNLCSWLLLCTCCQMTWCRLMHPIVLADPSCDSPCIQPAGRHALCWIKASNIIMNTTHFFSLGYTERLLTVLHVLINGLAVRPKTAGTNTQRALGLTNHNQDTWFCPLIK